MTTCPVITPPRFPTSLSGVLLFSFVGAQHAAPISARPFTFHRHRSSRLPALQQLQFCTPGIPSRRITRRKRFHGRFFNNVQRFFLRRSLARIHRRRWCLLGILFHSNPDSTPPRPRSNTPAARAL